MFHRPATTSDRGFTLVEIVVAIVLVGILSAVVVVGVGRLTDSGTAAACAASADATRTAAMTQLGATSPPDLHALVADDVLSVPTGTVVDPSGRALVAPTWTMWFTPGTPPTIVCTSGTGGALWTPADLPAGAALWFDAANASTLTTIGNAVSIWGDRSGAGRNASSASAVSRPVLTPAAIGGLPGVTFDGSDDRLTFDGSFIAGTNYTVAAVVARNSPKAWNPYLGGSVHAPNSNLVIGWRSNTALMFAQWANDLDVGVAGYTTTPGEIHVFRLDTGSGRGTWRNGTSLGMLNSSAPLTGWVGSTLGHYNGAFFSGAVGELVIVTEALAASDREKLEGYLAWKWGLTSELPGAHPFRAAPPLTP